MDTKNRLDNLRSKITQIEEKLEEADSTGNDKLVAMIENSLDRIYEDLDEISWY